MTMQVLYNSRWLPKMGNSADEYEDALCPDHNGQSDESRFRCAVADGASESTFAKQWANLLVRSYCVNNFTDPSALVELLPQLQTEWRSLIDTTGFSWFSREKLKEGAFCTFLGLNINQEVETDKSGKWTAMALGDTCLFHVRNRQLLRKFPLVEAEQFGTSPDLLSSVFPNTDLDDRFRIATDDWQIGDEFYLMTDALACWSMIEEENSTTDWLAYLDMFTNGEPSEFAEHVTALRSQHDHTGKVFMRDDDVTLVRVRLNVNTHDHTSLQ